MINAQEARKLSKDYTPPITCEAMLAYAYESIRNSAKKGGVNVRLTKFNFAPTTRLNEESYPYNEVFVELRSQGFTVEVVGIKGEEWYPDYTLVSWEQP